MQEEGSRSVRPVLPMWRQALRDASGATVAEVATPNVRMEGSIFASPIVGREKVRTSLRTAGRITDSLTFTQMGRQLGGSLGPGVFYQAPGLADGRVGSVLNSE